MKRFPKDISSFDPNDSRLHWKKVTQADGFTLRQAMLYFDSKNRHQEFIAKEKDSGGLVDNGSFIGADFRIKGNSFKRLQDELVGNLIRKLVSGELVTTGYAANSGIDEPAQVIPADRWRTLTPDLKSSGATSAGVAISGILVFKKRPLTPSSPRRSAATAHVRRWYKGWVDYNVKAGRQPSREDDERAAREALGSEVSRALLRQLRKELAPETWKRRGRPKNEG